MPDGRGLGGRAVGALTDHHRAVPTRRLPVLANATTVCSAAAALRRDFWAKNYAKIKAANGKLPILLRESSGTAAKVTAAYGAACRASRLAAEYILVLLLLGAPQSWPPSLHDPVRVLTALYACRLLLGVARAQSLALKKRSSSRG